MNGNQMLGRRGEDAAAAYLERLGWNVLDRNWRCSEGELDILAYDGRVHVACEVKTRRSKAFGDPLEAITERKAARLRKLALRWAAVKRVPGAHIRVDVIALVCEGEGFALEHLRGVC